MLVHTVIAAALARCIFALEITTTVNATEVFSSTTSIFPLIVVSTAYTSQASPKPAHSIYDLLNYKYREERAEQIAADAAALLAQLEADANRNRTRNEYPDYLEKGITPLLRLTRLATRALKETATAHELRWAELWNQWWHATHEYLPGDTRTSADRLFEYTVNRNAGTIAGDETTLKFEKALAILMCKVMQAECDVGEHV